MRKIKDVSEITTKELQEYKNTAYAVYATIEAIATALYHISGEDNPVNRAVTASFALEQAAKTLADVCGEMQDCIDMIEG